MEHIAGLDDLGIRKRVEDDVALAARGHDVLRAQNRQVLGNDGLRQVQRFRELANRSLARVKAVKDHESSGMGKCLKDLSVQEIDCLGELIHSVSSEVYSSIHIFS